MTDSTMRPDDDLRYHPPVPVWWWVRKASYFVFVMRELSSIFIAWLILYLLLFVRAVGRGEATYEAHLEWASSPWLVAVNLVAFAFVVLHTITWFSLTPQAMVLDVRGRRVPGAVIIGAQYAGLVVVSAFVFWLVTR
ncbi:MAG: fumarate reductase subunit C [Nocardioides sp.]